MKLFKKSLSALLALTMAVSTMAASMAFADEPVAGEEEGPETQIEYTAKSTYLRNYNRTPALDDGFYGDNGYAATAEEAGANAVEVKYTDAERLNNNNEVLWGVEMQRLPVQDYTLVFKFALVTPEVVANPGAIVTALSPVVRYQVKPDGVDGDDTVFDTDNLEYYSVEQLQGLMADAKSKGQQFIELSFPIQVSEFRDKFTQFPSDQLKIECRLSSNHRAAELGWGDGTQLDDGIGLAIYSLRLDKGATITNGWGSDGVYYENGEPAANKEVGNAASGFYFTDANGKPRKNYLSDAGYFYGADGRRVSNAIVTISGKKYYFDSTGKKPSSQVGKKLVSGKYYFIKAGGEIATNFSYGGNYYGADGAMIANRLFNGKGYDASGNMIKNKVAKLGGVLYAFGADGSLVSGNKVKVGSKYTCATKGVVKANTKTGKYITDANGYLIQNGVKKIKKTTYAVKNYKVVTGNKVVKIGKKSYAVKKGKVVTGKKQVVKIGKKSYAVKKTGQLYGKQKKLKIGKKTYKVAANGVAKQIKKKK